jgi:hypothetical protein
VSVLVETCAAAVSEWNNDVTNYHVRVRPRTYMGLQDLEVKSHERPFPATSPSAYRLLDDSVITNRGGHHELEDVYRHATKVTVMW